MILCVGISTDKHLTNNCSSWEISSCIFRRKVHTMVDVLHTYAFMFSEVFHFQHYVFLPVRQDWYIFYGRTFLIQSYCLPFHMPHSTTHLLQYEWYTNEEGSPHLCHDTSKASGGIMLGLHFSILWTARPRRRGAMTNSPWQRLPRRETSQRVKLKAKQSMYCI